MRGDDWDRLIAGVRSGDPTALRAFYERYREPIERVAARAISPAMLRRFGPESVAHSVCRTVMRRVGSAEVVVGDPDTLWSLLCAVALNKVRASARFHHREKRRVARASAADASLDILTSNEPGPDVIAAFHDGVAHALAALDAEERRVLEMRLAGATHGEIATALACSERTVRRLSVRLEARVREALHVEGDAAS